MDLVHGQGLSGQPLAAIGWLVGDLEAVGARQASGHDGRAAAVEVEGVLGAQESISLPISLRLTPML